MSATDWAEIGIFLCGVGIFLTAITLGFVVYDVTRPERRFRKLKNPVIAYFVIPSSYHHDCSFAHQNEHEHVVQRIVLPSHSEVIVDFALIPKMDFNTTNVIFACDGDTKVKPKMIEIYNRFVETGPRRHVVPGSPGVVDFIDKYWSFHVVENSRWTIGTTRAFGFKIRTSHPGIYRMPIYFIGEAVEGNISELSIKVADEPRDLMYFVDNNHHAFNCIVGIWPR